MVLAGNTEEHVFERNDATVDGNALEDTVVQLATADITLAKGLELVLQLAADQLYLSLR